MAYLIPRSQCVLSSSGLRSFLRQRLPEYMVPSIFVVLGSLPLTPSGKIDRRKLSTQTSLSSVLEEDYAPPRSPLEEMLVSIWVDILGLQLVSIHDNFFEIGGNSLLAVRVLSRLYHALQVEVPLNTFFELSTVAQLASTVEELLIDEVDELSEEEVEHLLQEHS